VLLIHWTKPAALEEFFVPPKGGLDWRVPKGLFSEDEIEGPSPWKDFLPNPLCTKGWSCTDRKPWNDPSFASRRLVVLSSILGNHPRATSEFRRVGQEKDAPDVFGEIFHRLFTPSPSLEKNIRLKMKKWSLVPGQFVAAHARVLYEHKTDKSGGSIFGNENDKSRCIKVANAAINAAINCNGRTKVVYFASDSNETVSYILLESVFSHSSDVRIVAQDSQPRVHVEYKGTRPVSDFYSSFEDLWIMSMSQCVAYGRGYFGKFAARVSKRGISYKV
jgi:hypothetical protein